MGNSCNSSCGKPPTKNVASKKRDSKKKSGPTTMSCKLTDVNLGVVDEVPDTLLSGAAPNFF